MIIKQHRYWRALEIFPGALTWAALIMPVVLSFFIPQAVAIFVIIYTMMWLFRSLRLTMNLFRSYGKVRIAMQTHWMKLIEYVDSPKKLVYDLDALEIEKMEDLAGRVRRLQEEGAYRTSDNLYHAIIYVTYKESLELIRESVRSYVEGSWSSRRSIFVFAGEERDRDNFLQLAKSVEKEFGKDFFAFIVTVHPQDIAGEIKGKSANATFAAKQLQKFLDEKGIDYTDVILSNFDADTVVHKDYFAELSFKYLITKKRELLTYQPVHMYHNNIWKVPTVIRLIALGSSFWRMAESVNKERYKSFSSRSMGFVMAVESGFWDPAVIPEDSRQYWTAYTLYNGEHYLVSLYCPLYMDAVLAKTYQETFKQQYIQLRRWAYGVCDFPFVVLNLLNNKKISRWRKFYNIFTLIEGHFFWATAPFLITFTGWLPGLLNTPFRDTVLSYNLPVITSTILNIAAVGVLACAVLTLDIVPPNPKRTTFTNLSLFFQWLLVPFSSIFLSALPAIEAQTRLMFNKRLEYHVTPKERKAV